MGLKRFPRCIQLLYQSRFCCLLRVYGEWARVCLSKWQVARIHCGAPLNTPRRVDARVRLTIRSDLCRAAISLHLGLLAAFVRFQVGLTVKKRNDWVVRLWAGELRITPSPYDANLCVLRSIVGVAFWHKSTCDCGSSNNITPPLLQSYHRLQCHCTYICDHQILTVSSENGSARVTPSAASLPDHTQYTVSGFDMLTTILA